MTNQLPLSSIMLDTLREIADNGGEIHSAGGGFWKFGNHKGSTTLTATVYALERRGLLERMHIDSRYYRDGRMLTDAGEELTGKANKESVPA